MTERSPSIENERKRKRLMNACIRCRTRKVKCDDRDHQCTNCFKANAACVTYNPRQPDAPAERREAQKDAPASAADHHRRAFSRTNSDHPTSRDGQGTSDERTPSVAVDHLSPVGLLPALPRFITGSSLFLLTQWLDLAFTRLGSPQHFSRHYRKSQDTGIKNVPLSAIRPTGDAELPRVREAQPSHTKWCASVGSVLPIFRRYGDPVHTANPVESGDGSDLLCILRTALINALIEGANTVSSVNMTLSYLGDIVLEGSLDSLEVLMLLAIITRSCGRMELAWQLTSLAISIAQTLGLHRHVDSSSAPTEVAGQGIRKAQAWWSIYIIDKMLCIELERVSMIRDLDCNQRPLSEHREAAYDLFQTVTVAAVQLATIQGEVTERLTQSRAAEELHRDDLERVIVDKMRLVGELDGQLTRWAEQLPSEIRPSEYLYADPEALPGVAHLAIQYQQTLFLLHRHALILNTSTVQQEVAKHFADQPYRQRLRNGHNICSNATRAIVGILSHLRESGIHTVLSSSHAPLLAAYGLAIQIVRHPGASAAKSDLELQATAMQTVREYQQAHIESGLANVTEITTTRSLLDTLHDMVRACVVRTGSQSAASTASVYQRQRVDTPILANHALAIADCERVISPPQPQETTETAYKINGPGSQPTFDANPCPNISSGRTFDFNTEHENWSNAMNMDPMSFDNQWGSMDMDWDALTVAFDLPQ
ncbi:hypothetical protein LTR10_003887 [Elasticomyces elasticus]|nr:hypothetical protein LTR10_003887 [Elasticomyces elasticus]